MWSRIPYIDRLSRLVERQQQGSSGACTAAYRSVSRYEPIILHRTPIIVRLYEAAPTAQTCYSLFLCFFHRRRGILQPARAQTGRRTVQTSGFVTDFRGVAAAGANWRRRESGKSSLPKKCSSSNSGGNHPLFGSGKFPPNILSHASVYPLLIK